MALLAQLLQRVLDRSALVQRALGEPHIEVDTEPLEAGPHLVEHDPVALVPEQGARLRVRQVERLRVLGDDPARRRR